MKDSLKSFLLANAFLISTANLIALPVDRPEYPTSLYSGPLGCIPTVSALQSFLSDHAVNTSDESIRFTVEGVSYAAQSFATPIGLRSECPRLYPRYTDYCNLDSITICPKIDAVGKPSCTVFPDYSLSVSGPSPEGVSIMNYAFNSETCLFDVSFTGKAHIQLVWRSPELRVETFDPQGNFLEATVNEQPITVQGSWGLNPALISKRCAFTNLAPLRRICQ